jgi:hypothetical protein
MSTTKEKLIEARRLIKDVGWCKGYSIAWSQNYKEKLAYCSLGALYQTHYNSEVSLQDLNKALDTLQDVVIHIMNEEINPNLPQYNCIAKWNDNPIRTKSEILNAFSIAIDLVED